MGIFDNLSQATRDLLGVDQEERERRRLERQERRQNRIDNRKALQVQPNQSTQPLQGILPDLGSFGSPATQQSSSIQPKKNTAVGTALGALGTAAQFGVDVGVNTAKRSLNNLRETVLLGPRFGVSALNAAPTSLSRLETSIAATNERFNTTRQNTINGILAGEGISSPISTTASEKGGGRFNLLNGLSTGLPGLKPALNILSDPELRQSRKFGDIVRESFTSTTGGLADAITTGVDTAATIEGALQAPQYKKIGEILAREASQGIGVELGSVSSFFESEGSGGVAAINLDDPVGGASFGSHQMTKDTVLNFINDPRYNLAQYFPTQDVESPAFHNAWRNLAQQDPEGFERLQKAHIVNTHFQPQINKLSRAGYDIDNFSQAMREVIFSTAVQHGPNTSIVLNALNNGGDELEVIRAIYEDRSTRFKSSTPQIQRNVRERFRNEFAMIREIMDEEVKTTAPAITDSERNLLTRVQIREGRRGDINESAEERRQRLRVFASKEDPIIKTKLNDLTGEPKDILENLTKGRFDLVLRDASIISGQTTGENAVGIGVAIATRGKKLPSSIASYSQLMGASYDEFEYEMDQLGYDVSDPDVREIIWYGANHTAIPQVITEVMPTLRLIKRNGLDKLFSASANKSINDQIAELTTDLTSKLANAGSAVIEQSLLEGLTEGVQEIEANIVEQIYYNPEAKIGEGVLESALIGAIAGGGQQSVASVGSIMEDMRQETKASRRATILDLLKEKASVPQPPVETVEDATQAPQSSLSPESITLISQDIAKKVTTNESQKLVRRAFRRREGNQFNKRLRNTSIDAQSIALRSAQTPAQRVSLSGRANPVTTPLLSLDQAQTIEFQGRKNAIMELNDKFFNNNNPIDTSVAALPFKGTSKTQALLNNETYRIANLSDVTRFEDAETINRRFNERAEILEADIISTASSPDRITSSGLSINQPTPEGLSKLITQTGAKLIGTVNDSQLGKSMARELQANRIDILNLQREAGYTQPVGTQFAADRIVTDQQAAEFQVFLAQQKTQTLEGTINKLARDMKIQDSEANQDITLLSQALHASYVNDAKGGKVSERITRLRKKLAKDGIDQATIQQEIEKLEEMEELNNFAGMSNEEAEATAIRIRDKYAEHIDQLETIVNEIQNFSRLVLDWSLQVGRITKTQHKIMTTLYPLHIPLERYGHDIETNRGFRATIRSLMRPARDKRSLNIAVQGMFTGLVERSVGSDKKVLNPVKSIFGRAVKTIRFGVENGLRRQLALELTRNNMEGVSVRPAREVNKKAFAAIREIEKAGGKVPVALLKDTVRFTRQEADEIAYYDNGEKKYLKIKDKSLRNAVYIYRRQTEFEAGLSDIFGFFNRYFKTVILSNPATALNLSVFDAVMASTSLMADGQAKAGFKVLSSTIRQKNIKDVMGYFARKTNNKKLSKRDLEIELWMKLGIGSGTNIRSDVNSSIADDMASMAYFTNLSDPIAKTVGKKLYNTASAPIEYYMRLLRSLEIAKRIAIADAMIATGASKQQAIVAARRFLYNPQEQGRLGGAMNTWFMFFTAAVGFSPRELARVMRNPYTRIVLMAGLIGMAEFEDDLNSLIDPNWRSKVNKYDRQNGYVFLLPKTLQNDNGDEILNYVTIKLPHAFRPVKAMSDASRELASGTMSAGTAFLYVMDSVRANFDPISAGSPAQSLAPTFARPAVSVAQNISTFNETKLGDGDPQRLFPTPVTDVPPYEQVFSSYGDTKAEQRLIEFSRKMYEEYGISISPAVFSALYKGYVDMGINRFAIDAVQMAGTYKEEGSLEVEDIPLVSGYVGQTRPNTVFFQKQQEVQVLQEIIDKSKPGMANANLVDHYLRNPDLKPGDHRTLLQRKGGSRIAGVSFDLDNYGSEASYNTALIMHTYLNSPDPDQRDIVNNWLDTNRSKTRKQTERAMANWSYIFDNEQMSYDAYAQHLNDRGFDIEKKDNGMYKSDALKAMIRSYYKGRASINREQNGDWRTLEELEDFIDGMGDREDVTKNEYLGSLMILQDLYERGSLSSSTQREIPGLRQGLDPKYSNEYKNIDLEYESLFKRANDNYWNSVMIEVKNLSALGDIGKAQAANLFETMPEAYKVQFRDEINLMKGREYGNALNAQNNNQQ